MLYIVFCLDIMYFSLILDLFVLFYCLQDIGIINFCGMGIKLIKNGLNKESYEKVYGQ